MKKNRKGQAKVISTPGLDKVTTSIPSMLHRAVVITLRNTGARISEVVQLRWEDLDKSEIQFPKEITKNKLDTRSIPISKDYFNLMNTKWKSEWARIKGREPSEKDYIFPGRFADSHISSRAVMYALTDAFERAEITGATSHSFRRTQLSKLHKSGVPLKVIQSLSGHRNLGTLQRYLEVDDADKRAAVTLLA